MNLQNILLEELQRSVNFFLDFTNFDHNSSGFGLTVDTTKKPEIASIASTGFALTAWVIAANRGWLDHKKALEITRGTLHTLLNNVDHYNGFFAHFLLMDSGKRYKTCEFSTIDTSICLNGIITANAFFQDDEISDLSNHIIQRVNWKFLVFEKDEKLLFRMAYNPDFKGDYVKNFPGFISQWDMAAEQKMMYLQAANTLNPYQSKALYHGFSRDKGFFNDQEIIVNPGGNLFAYQFSEAWLDTEKYLDPDGIDWSVNTKLAIMANRQFCIDYSKKFRTYHARSWGLSAGDNPHGYAVSGAAPSLYPPHHDGTVSIYSAIASLPFVPDQTLEMIDYLYSNQPHTWGKYGFFDSYNLDVNPHWYSHSIYGIDKGVSMIMIENHLSRLIWETYTNCELIQKSLKTLNFTKK